MDYKSTYETIINWAGTATQYWVAVDLLKAKNQLTPSEINQCNEGLTEESAELIVFKIFVLKALCLGSENDVYSFDPDDIAPDVSKGTATYQVPQATSNDKAIIMLDNAVVGSRIVLEWMPGSPGLETYLVSVENGTVFALEGAFQPVVGAKLVLEVQSPNHFVELYRFIP